MIKDRGWRIAMREWRHPQFSILGLPFSVSYPRSSAYGQTALDQFLQFRNLERFTEVFRPSRLGGLLANLIAIVSRKDDYWQLLELLLAADFARRLQTVYNRQRDVHQDKVRLFLMDSVDRLPPVFNLDHIKPGVLEYESQRGAIFFEVFGYQNASLFFNHT